MEMIWAVVKNAVAHQYTIGTSFKDQTERLKAAFAQLKDRTVKGCIEKANESFKRIYCHTIMQDLSGDEASSEASEDEESSGEESSDSDEEEQEGDEEEGGEGGSGSGDAREGEDEEEESSESD